MADINQVITLGIGTPSDIEHFVLVGLNANPSYGGIINATLYNRSIKAGTLEDRDIKSGTLYNRKFKSGTLEDRPDG